MIAAQAAPDAASGADSEPEHEHREGEEDVNRARDQGVGPTAVEARDQTHHSSEHGGDRGAEDADLKRHARAIDDAREDVAAELVDAERMRRAGPGRAAESVERVGVVHVRALEPKDLDDQRRGDRDDDQEDDERRRHHRDLVLAEAAPEQLRRRARRDVAGDQLDAIDTRFGFDAELGGANAHRLGAPLRRTSASPMRRSNHMATPVSPNINASSTKLTAGYAGEVRPS